MTEHPFIIVVGASAGGITPLAELVAQLDPEINAAVFIVLHLSNTGIGSFLKEKIQRYTSLSCVIAENNMPLKKGQVYLAPPDFHLLIKDDKTITRSGPPENRWRPSIDVLFRSAAVSHTDRVIGVILTGLLDDGTAGMVAVAGCGGTTIVQDPEEAQYPDTPLSVLQAIPVDYVAKLAEMGEIISTIIATKVIHGVVVPAELKAEAGIAERMASSIAETATLGVHTVYSCPDCGGGLWEMKNGDKKAYRCYTGHKYSERELFAKQGQKLESALWVSIRMMEEKKNLLIKLSEQDKARGFKKTSTDYDRRSVEFEGYIGTIKELLFSLHDEINPS
jgi:two-component system, chemotaxis family, protein-glutamate methylesterase/glutaminase